MRSHSFITMRSLHLYGTSVYDLGASTFRDAAQSGRRQWPAARSSRPKRAGVGMEFQVLDLLRAEFDIIILEP